MLPISDLGFRYSNTDDAAVRRLIQERAYLNARCHYDRARSQAGLRRLWAVLTGRPWALRRLADLGGAIRSGARHLADVQQVPLARIVGTDNRAHDFDCRFAPLHDHTRDRWISVAAARVQGHDLPPVELVQVGDDYYVVDGHHRVSVARAFGETTIAAHVLIGVACAHAPAACAGPVFA